MNDNNVIPISDEQSKLAKEMVEAGRDLGGYLADILGDLPKDLVGLLIGDRVKAIRVNRIAILWGRAKNRLNDRGISEPEPPSLKLALPILAAAADESREELQELWEGLLAAAMDPNRKDLVRQSLISTVKEMDAFDALVFEAVAKNGQAPWTPTGREAIASRLQAESYEVLVWFDNIKRLNCIKFPGGAPEINPYSAPLGMLLIRAIA